MKYFALNAKIKAMRGNLLTAENYSVICDGGGDISGLSGDDWTRILPYAGKNSREFLQSIDFMSFASKPLGMLDKSDKASLTRIFGAAADLKNILTIYRLKKYHKISGDALFSFLSPKGLRLGAEEYSALAHAADIEIFFRLVSEGAYGGIFGDFSHPEQAFSREIRARFRKEYFRENLSIACGYLYDRFLQEKNLRAIYEGRKSGLSRDEILAFLHI